MFISASNIGQLDYFFVFVLFFFHCCQDADGKEVAITSDEKVG